MWYALWTVWIQNESLVNWFTHCGLPSGVATGVARGQIATPDSEKIAKNQEKLGKNPEKRGKIGKKRQKSGSFFHFATPDR